MYIYWKPWILCKRLFSPTMRDLDLIWMEEKLKNFDEVLLNGSIQFKFRFTCGNTVIKLVIGDPTRNIICVVNYTLMTGMIDNLLGWLTIYSEITLNISLVVIFVRGNNFLFEDSPSKALIIKERCLNFCTTRIRPKNSLIFGFNYFRG